MFIDYENSFGTVDHHSMVRTLADFIMDQCYINISIQIHKNANAAIRLDELILNFKMENGMRQGDVICQKNIHQSVLSYKHQW